MYQGYKIVCVTPAGRRRYMKLLAPYILSCNLVDRWDIWENTDNKDDMSFFNTLSEQYEIVRIIKHPTGIIKGSVSINDFYPDNSTDKDTVYIRFDDDIVWISPDFFKNFLALNKSQFKKYAYHKIELDRSLSGCLLFAH